jgi:hypothetical protein
VKNCRHCDAPIRPKPTIRGMESPSQTSARKFCGRHCWREWLRSERRTQPARLYVLEQRTVARRRFRQGQLVWYTRSLAETYGWPVRVPARFDAYTHDFGRSRVTIYVRTARGREVLVTTQDWKLSLRTASDTQLLARLPEFNVPLRFCELCEAAIPQVSPGGKVLSPVVYEQRRFCRKACADTAHKKKAA